ncbi:MAG: cupin domain-containing protein [Desulfitobacteriia bacterium]|jgi:quercetin dioxygenase-like cupin family protein
MEKKHYLKNIDYETVLDLASLVEYRTGQVVSLTMSQNKYVSLTLFAFDKNEEISTHSSTGDAMIYILDGSAHVKIGSKTYDLNKGQTIVMPANIPHAVKALEKFKMLLIVVFPS